jgi:adenine-specific DNA-methyltransferase
MPQQRLELTWIGKGEEPQLEPRILIEDPDKSYGEAGSDNMLIHGDNLLALKALEQEYAGKVKCIYIDPPYNTGSAFEHYEDGLEHSEWLNLMVPRLRLLRNLLSDDGTIFVSIDNNEMAYLQVIMDEIFERSNRKNIVTLKRGSVTGAKVRNPGLVNISEFLISYSKNKDCWKPNRVYGTKDRDSRYSSYISNHEEPYEHWKFCSLLDAFSVFKGVKKTKVKKALGESFESEIISFVLQNADKVIQFATLDDKNVSQEAVVLKYKSKSDDSKVYYLDRGIDISPYYVFKGKLILFVRDRLKEIDGELSFSQPLTDIWMDVLPNDLHNEGGVDFRKGKKPEKFLQRVLELSTDEGDIVLDSFLGSGSTAAVANKMKRRWIGIELGEHANTHCLPRLKSVVDGIDTAGITKSLDWKGGGGFKFYNLAPSLLRKDDLGQWVIDGRYNADQLAAAMAKHEGYTYAPDTDRYWKQAYSTENDYLYTTTQLITPAVVDHILEQLGPEESLLICCKAYQKGAAARDPRINLHKIPSILTDRCEFGKDDYSLNIVDAPKDEDAPEFVPAGQQAARAAEAEELRKYGKQKNMFD